MTDDDLLALLDRELGPVLTPAGFSGAQGGWPQTIFCTGFGGFTERFGWLPQAHPEEWHRNACVDLTLEFDQTTGLLARVDLELKSLPATLYALGEGALSAELKTAYALPLTESLPVVAKALTRVFTGPADGGADDGGDDLSWA